MKFTDAEGNIYLLNEEGYPINVASVKYGITYGVNKTQSVKRVTINTQYCDLTDIWLFYSKDKMPFHHIQSRDLIPKLKECYLDFILNSETHSMEDFLTTIISDYFIASEPFARALVGENNPVEACRKVAHLGPRVVGVTLGSKGYVAWVEGRIIERPAHPVEAVDTTGCGDVFHAGFIYGLIQGWDTERSLDFAAWSAAMVSRKMGGRSGIPTLREIAEQGYR